MQYITIDHCWIDRQVKAKNKIAIDFEVLNQAGLTTGTRRIKVGNSKFSFFLFSSLMNAIIISALRLGGTPLQTKLVKISKLLSVYFYLFIYPVEGLFLSH